MKKNYNLLKSGSLILFTFMIALAYAGGGNHAKRKGKHDRDNHERSELCSKQVIASFDQSQGNIFKYIYSADIQSGNNSNCQGDYTWDFGDGNISIDKNGNHTYANSGSYTITLIVNKFPKNSKNACYDTLVFNITIGTPCNLSSMFASAVNFDTVQFASISTTNPNYSGSLNYSWDFGDGNFSSISNPTHIYGASGTYNVCLTVTRGNDANCTDNYCEQITVTQNTVVCPTDLANFIYQINGNYIFFNSSTACSSCVHQWDFGDGNSSTLTHPFNQFASIGTYTVTHTVTDPSTGCVNQSSQTINMLAPQRYANPIATSSNVLNESKINVYPNPIQNNLNLISDSFEGGEYSINVFNVLGSKVFSSSQAISRKASFDMSSLENGNYIVHIIDNATQEVYIQKIMKN